MHKSALVASKGKKKRNWLFSNSGMNVRILLAKLKVKRQEVKGRVKQTRGAMKHWYRVKLLIFTSRTGMQTQCGSGTHN